MVSCRAAAPFLSTFFPSGWTLGGRLGAANCALRQFVSLTIMLMILNTLQPEAPLYRRLLLCVCSVVVCMAEARTCDYFLTNKTSPRTPMKRHALQISGVMRTLGEAYPKMRRLLVLPNAMDVFAALVYDDKDKAQIDSINHFMTLPEVVAVQRVPRSSVNYDDRKKAMMKEHPNWDIWGDYLHRPHPKTHWLAITAWLQAENYMATKQLRSMHEVMTGWSYDTVTRIRPDYDFSLPAALNIEGIVRESNTFYVLTCGSTSYAASDQFGLGSVEVMDELAGMIHRFDPNRSYYPGAGEAVTTRTIVSAGEKIELISLLACKGLQLLPNASIESGIKLHFNDLMGNSTNHSSLHYVVVGSGDPLAPYPDNCPMMAVGNESISSFVQCSLRCDGVHINRGRARVPGDYSTRLLKSS